MGGKPEVVVITGASAGVGRATARAFGKRRAHIGLLARGREGLEAAKQEVEAEGGKALVFSVDVANAEQMEATAASVEENFGPIDIWINNAMASVFSPVKEMTPEEFRRVTEVTYLGYVYGTLSALRRMLPRNHGVIIQVGSALAYRGIPLQSAYCGAKHAIQGFTESLRCELLHDESRVRLTMVQMPALNTPQFSWVKNRLRNKPQPVPPIFQPELAAEAIIWAVEQDRPEVYVGWPTIKAIVLGDKIAPRLADAYLARTGYEAQQTDAPEDRNRPDNLWEPVPGDHGAHGDFDSRAYEKSWQFYLTKNRRWWAPIGGLVIASLLALMSLKATRPA
ncbi:MAG TPA: SDR family oxidoreductase [Candidatus Binatia bacterium]|nr:SDR family oxidoreductase [Candidatus Binatia bacterium]